MLEYKNKLSGRVIVVEIDQDLLITRTCACACGFGWPTFPSEEYMFLFCVLPLRVTLPGTSIYVARSRASVIKLFLSRSRLSFMFS